MVSQSCCSEWSYKHKVQLGSHVAGKCEGRVYQYLGGVWKPWCGCNGRIGESWPGPLSTKDLDKRQGPLFSTNGSIGHSPHPLIRPTHHVFGLNITKINLPTCGWIQIKWVRGWRRNMAVRAQDGLCWLLALCRERGRREDAIWFLSLLLVACNHF